LINAPRKIEVDDVRYHFIQTWDENGDPIVEMIMNGREFMVRIFSPNDELPERFKKELHTIWNEWNKN